LNALASSSGRNAGTALSFFAGVDIAVTLQATHIADRDDADTLAADGERGGEEAEE
jgi:hypothetical protein